mgnify:CR=1 FL=1
MFETVKKILVEQLGVSEDRITMEANIVEDLEADSLSVMQTIMELEEEFGLTVEDEDVTTWADEDGENYENDCVLFVLNNESIFAASLCQGF